MRWKQARRSDNLVDLRGGGSSRGGRGPGGGLGLVGIAIVVLVALALGRDPMELLGLLDTVQAPAPTTEGAPPPDDETAEFIARIQGETEDIWKPIFAERGLQYPPPKLVLFSGQVRSACGSASAAVGPFYCPGDQRIYLDTSFFRAMQQRLGGGGDFAYAYVIAHEVGHHVQTLLGVSAEVHAARQRGQNVQGDGGLLVRQELQADCYAGVWGHRAQARHQWLEEGDIEEALNTASAIGDDALQRQSQGQVVPDAFSHGTSAQRLRWFRIGFDSGDPSRCDTFSAALL